MRTPVLIALAALGCGRAAPEPPPSTLQAAVERAADRYGVPRSLLLATAFVDSRFELHDTSLDGSHGLLHLIDRDDAPDALSLPRAARLSGLSADALRTDAYAGAQGGAALIRAEADAFFAEYKDLDERKLGDWWQLVMRLSGSRDARVADSYAAQVYRVLRDGFALQLADGSVARLAPQDYDSSGRAVWGAIEQDLSGEYCPNGACVAFVPASTSNYTGGRGPGISMVVIHDMEGSYSGSISWFQNPSAQASAHYMVRSSDGDITQMIHHGDVAWHAGNWTINTQSIGIEHEGYAHTGAQWYTEAMYRSSAALTRWLCDTFHIPKDRSHIIGHYEVPDPNHAGWFGGSGHHHDPCDSWNGNPTWHNNVACYWDWNHYMDLVTGGGPAATGSIAGFVGDACCGIAAGSRKPLAGAAVVLKNTSYTTTTGADGMYGFTVPPGSYTPVASASGFDPGDHSSLGSGYSPSVTVTSGGTIYGSIVLHPTQPVATPPTVTIASPADGAALSQSPAQVRGTVSDPAINTVKINGQDFPASNGAYSGTVALAQGANTITVTASNAGGTGTAVTHVSFAPPQTGVQGKITGPSGAVAGAGVTLTPGNAHTVSGADGSYEVQAPAGSYTLAVDAAGFNPLSQAATVPADRLLIADLALTPLSEPGTPHIRIDSPADGVTVDTDSVVVGGVAEVPGLTSLTVNGEQIDVDGQGGFSVVVSLHLGPNEIAVHADSMGGRSADARVGVEYAPVALGRSGCQSVPPGALGLLGLALWMRRRWR